MLNALRIILRHIIQAHHQLLMRVFNLFQIAEFTAFHLFIGYQISRLDIPAFPVLFDYKINFSLI